MTKAEDRPSRRRARFPTPAIQGKLGPWRESPMSDGTVRGCRVRETCCDWAGGWLCVGEVVVDS